MEIYLYFLAHIINHILILSGNSAVWMSDISVCLMTIYIYIYTSHKLAFLLKYDISIKDNCDAIDENTIGKGVVCIYKCYGMMRAM